MLSRVADSVFWMNRQIERAENVARAIETTLGLALEGTIEPGRLWNALVCAFGDQSDFWARHGLADQARVFDFLAFDPANPNSIYCCLQAARENARTVRDMISSPMWEEINKCYLAVRGASAARADFADPREFIDEIQRASQLITGATDGTMSHGEAWHFARMGRLVERADKTSRFLDVEHFFGGGEGAGRDPVRWSSVLESASALEMYRKQYGAVSRKDTVRFLVLDRAFPRAMHFCLVKAEESLLAITGGTKGTHSTPAERQLGRLRATLDYTDIDEILGDSQAGAPRGLHGWIDAFQARLNAANDAIHTTFFALRPVGTVAEAG